MQWAGKSAYGNSSWVPFSVEGEEKGTARVAEPLSFLRVRGGQAIAIAAGA